MTATGFCAVSLVCAATGTAKRKMHAIFRIMTRGPTPFGKGSFLDRASVILSRADGEGSQVETIVALEILRSAQDDANATPRRVARPLSRKILSFPPLRKSSANLRRLPRAMLLKNCGGIVGFSATQKIALRIPLIVQ